MERQKLLYRALASNFRNQFALTSSLCAFLHRLYFTRTNHAFNGRCLSTCWVSSCFCAGFVTRMLHIVFVLTAHYHKHPNVNMEPGQRRLYSNWLRAGRSGVRIPVGTNFPYQSRSALGITQPPMQWVPGLLPRGWSGRGVALITHLH